MEDNIHYDSLSREMISSDDVFDYILKKRNNNKKIRHEMDTILNMIRPKNVYHLKSAKDVQQLKDHEKFKKWTRGRLISEFVGDTSPEYSNGETAIRYFTEHIRPDSLYLLDEPENSLSPGFQIELASILEQTAYRCNSQFIIATHSPFILSLHGARIYDLDDANSAVKKWHELENMRTYFDFFLNKKEVFLNRKGPASCEAGPEKRCAQGR